MGKVRNARWEHREVIKADSNKHGQKRAYHPQVRRQIIDMDQQEQDFQLYCDHCNMPTLLPEHAHYKCSNCGQRTSCCEGV